VDLVDDVVAEIVLRTIPQSLIRASQNDTLGPVRTGVNVSGVRAGDEARKVLAGITDLRRSR
jgi:hypothetical protein